MGKFLGHSLHKEVRRDQEINSKILEYENKGKRIFIRECINKHHHYKYSINNWIKNWISPKSPQVVHQKAFAEPII